MTVDNQPSQHLNADDYWFEGNAMAAVRERARRAANSDLPVLVYGPLGSGRAHIANWLHRHGKQRAALIRFSCTASDEQADRELFGFRNHPGLVKAAEGGTLYLDDIANLPISAQGRLLHLLEDHQSRCIENTLSFPAKLRVIAGTRHDLSAAYQQGQFLEELLIYLEGLQLRIPPLSQRSQPELRNLVEELLRRENARHSSEQEMKLSRSAMKTILNHSWPGNMRELENALCRAIVLHRNNNAIIETHMLELTSTQGFVSTPKTATATAQKTAVATRSVSEELSLEEYFQRFILEHQGAMSETKLARKLGISRKCLWERRQRFGIPRSANKSPIPNIAENHETALAGEDVAGSEASGNMTSTLAQVI